MADKLTRVVEIELAGEKYVIAKNGGYQLTRVAGVDPFGVEFHEVVKPYEYTHPVNEHDKAKQRYFVPERVEALIDKLGEALASLERARDLRQASGSTGSGE